MDKVSEDRIKAHNAVLRAIAEKRAAEQAPPAPQPAAAAAPAVPGKPMIPTLNRLLTSEFVAIHQYTGHYAILKNMGYEKLAAYALEHLNDERRHADMLAYRIVFLGGTPSIADQLDASLGTSVSSMFEKDKIKEEGAIQSYNDAIAEAVAAKDNVTREMLEAICKDEDHHTDEISTYQAQVKEMGIGPFLVTQV